MLKSYKVWSRIIPSSASLISSSSGRTFGRKSPISVIIKVFAKNGAVFEIFRGNYESRMKKLFTPAVVHFLEDLRQMMNESLKQFKSRDRIIWNPLHFFLYPFFCPVILRFFPQFRLIRYPTLKILDIPSNSKSPAKITIFRL